MQWDNFLRLSSDPHSGGVTILSIKKAAYRSILHYITHTTKGCPLAPDELEGVLTCTRSEWEETWKMANIGIVQAAFAISEKSFNISSIEADIVLKHNEVQEKGRMSFSFRCHGNSSPNLVADSHATRRNSADGSIDSYFNNRETLHMMGLKFKPDDKFTIMRILWQFNGAARNDTQESLALYITGGTRDCLFENNLSKRYSILRMQDHFTLRGASEEGELITDTEIIRLNTPDIRGVIIDGKYDEGCGEWKLQIFDNIDIDGERAFAGTECILTHPMTITAEGISLRLEPIGRPTRRRNPLKLFA